MPLPRVRLAQSNSPLAETPQPKSLTAIDIDRVVIVQPEDQRGRFVDIFPDRQRNRVPRALHRSLIDRPGSIVIQSDSPLSRRSWHSMKLPPRLERLTADGRRPIETDAASTAIFWGASSTAGHFNGRISLCARSASACGRLISVCGLGLSGDVGRGAVTLCPRFRIHRAPENAVRSTRFPTTTAAGRRCPIRSSASCCRFTTKPLCLTTLFAGTDAGSIAAARTPRSSSSMTARRTAAGNPRSTRLAHSACPRDSLLAELRPSGGRAGRTGPCQRRRRRADGFRPARRSRSHCGSSWPSGRKATTWSMRSARTARRAG